jgi:hypothetical protein
MDYPCGHPRSAENSYRYSYKHADGEKMTGVRCRICRNEKANQWEREHVGMIRIRPVNPVGAPYALGYRWFLRRRFVFGWQVF